MKIGLSFVTLASAAVLALGASAAQARDVKVGEGQATTAQAQAARAAAALAALQFRAAAEYFPELKRYQTRHQTMHRSLPSNMRGQDQLSTPGWSGELPF